MIFKVSIFNQLKIKEKLTYLLIYMKYNVYKSVYLCVYI